MEKINNITNPISQMQVYSILAINKEAIWSNYGEITFIQPASLPIIGNG
jgi:hypothetical protein